MLKNRFLIFIFRDLIAFALAVHLFLFPTISFGSSDCAPLDLRESLGDVRDQSPTGWCYAHSAADLVSQAIGGRVSAVDLAFAYLFEDEERLYRSQSVEIRRYQIGRAHV